MRSRFSCVYTICKVRGYAWPWTLVTNSLQAVQAEISWTYLRQQSVDLWRKSQTPDTTASASNIIDQDDPTSVIASSSSAMVVTKHRSDYGKKKKTPRFCLFVKRSCSRSRTPFFPTSRISTCSLREREEKLMTGLLISFHDVYRKLSSHEPPPRALSKRANETVRGDRATTVTALIHVSG